MIANENTSVVLLTMNAWFTGTCVALYWIRAAIHSPPVPGTTWNAEPGIVAVPGPVTTKLFCDPFLTSRFKKKASEVDRVKLNCVLPAQFKGGRIAMPCSQPKPVTWIAYSGLEPLT